MNDDVGQPVGFALEKLLSTMLTVIADSGSTGRSATPNPTPTLTPTPTPTLTLPPTLNTSRLDTQLSRVKINEFYKKSTLKRRPD